MAKREAKSLRREFDRIGARRGPCFSEDLERRATAWIVKRRSAGIMVAEIASELGLARGTVMKWSAGARATRTILPVEVIAEPSAERTVSVVLTCPRSVDRRKLQTCLSRC